MRAVTLKAFMAALDVGTTSLVGALLDLESGKSWPRHHTICSGSTATMLFAWVLLKPDGGLLTCTESSTTPALITSLAQQCNILPDQIFG